MLDPRTWLTLGAAVISAAVVFYAGDQVGYMRGHAEAVAVHELWNDAKARSLAQVINANQARDSARAELDDYRRESHVQAQHLARARADDAAGAERAADGLRRAFAAQLAACRGAGDTGPGPVGPGAPAPGGAGLVLAGVFAGSDESAGVLAAFADDSRARGLQCEAEYSALALALKAAGGQAKDRQHGQQEAQGAQAAHKAGAEGRAVDPLP